MGGPKWKAARGIAKARQLHSEKLRLSMLRGSIMSGAIPDQKIDHAED
jgi:hypothetical protein